MKYLLLLALTTTAIAVSLTGCARDIYRADYKYQEPPPADIAAPVHSPNAPIAAPNAG